MPSQELQQVGTIFSLLDPTGLFTSLLIGSHRLWSHRSFKASAPLRLFLVLAGGSAVQGSAYWWAKVHRSHHRYIDTDKDPYSAQRGFLFTHVGWIVFYTDVAPGGGVDLSDLHKDKILMWQHNNRALVWLLCGYILPTVIPGYFWGDWAGGLFYSTALRLTACYHVRSPPALSSCTAQ